MKKFLCLLTVAAFMVTFAACSTNSEIEDLRQQIKEMQSRLEQQDDKLAEQEDRITELEIDLEVYKHLVNFTDYDKQFNLQIIEGGFAFSFAESTSVPYFDFFKIPDGVVINSAEGIEKLAAISYDNAPEETSFADAAEFLNLLTTEHFFEEYSFLLTNFYRSSTDQVIGFSSYTIDNNCLNLIFDFEDDYFGFGTCDVIIKPYIFCIKKIENIPGLEIYSNNSVPWPKNYVHELIYY